MYYSIVSMCGFQIFVGFGFGFGFEKKSVFGFGFGFGFQYKIISDNYNANFLGFLTYLLQLLLLFSSGAYSPDYDNCSNVQ